MPAGDTGPASSRPGTEGKALHSTPSETVGVGHQCTAGFPRSNCHLLWLLMHSCPALQIWAHLSFPGPQPDPIWSL